MGKQLELTKDEQDIVTNAIMAISEILFLKMDDGVESQTLEGTNEVDNEDKMITFEIIAKKKS